MGEVPGAALLGAAVLAEGGRRAGGGVGEVVGEVVVRDAGEAQAESLVGDAGARRWWASQASWASRVWAHEAVACRTAAAC